MAGWPWRSGAIRANSDPVDRFRRDAPLDDPNLGRKAA